MQILIFAPHPDDEVLGCGGTIAKYTRRGDDVIVCYITAAYPPDWTEEFLQKRAEEIRRSNEILRISGNYTLNYPTARLDTIPQKEINDSLSRIVQNVRPDIAFLPHRGDLNKDHRIVHDAGLVALRPLAHRCSKILVYETLSETEWGPGTGTFEPQLYVSISDTVQEKIQAMEAYGSELKEYPHPRSREGILTLSRKRGSEILAEYAESFSVIRMIED
jgi:LmbE family N-acetylglucosaminyl deacetylase